jgi:pimeloyl-ACP methyl ester carboxylesterase
MGRLMKDELFEAQLLRTMGYAPFGAADIGECLATAGRIAGTDLDEWHDQWLATADRVRGVAEVSAAAGHSESARSGFFRASNYFRTAGLFAMGSPIDARLVAAHRLEVESFRRGAALMEQPPEIVTIPYEGCTMPGYLFRPDGESRPRPTVILTNGYDGTAEELYFTNGAAALARGYNVLTFDGPGQGAMIIDQDVPFRPDWENVIAPVVDFVLEQPGIDPERIALMGLSFGGYLAPRAATKEHRLAACISDCGPYDLFDATVSRLPGAFAAQLPNGRPALLHLLNRIATFVMKKPTAGWALRRNLMVHGLTSPLEYFRMAPQYSLKGIEHEIRCPTFVCSTDADDLGVNAPKLFDALTCPGKKYVPFAAVDGAGEHCESGARTAFHQQALNWLDEILTPTIATPAVS